MAKEILSLEQYLLSRDLSESDRDLDTEILDKPELLSKAAAAWLDSKEGIRLVVQSRLMKIREQLIFTAIPQEVPVLRQSLVEIAGLLEDFERYAAENKRRIEAPKSE